MNKVTIKLLGGLGNNLFQMAATYAYSLRHNKELFLVKEKFGATHGTFDSYANNILHKVKFSSINDLKVTTAYNEATFRYIQIPYMEGDIYLNGYFQSELYFKDYSKEIREKFSYPTDYIEGLKEKYKHILSLNTCSIHARRGDYVNQPENHPTQNMNYYMKAIKKMPEDSVFLIFSDDISWCKQNFPDIPEKFIFIEGNKDYEDLAIMSLCKNNIICNSSFSWWGAWLNSNPQKIVVSPKKWFGPAVSYDPTDLYCDGWIII